MKSNCCQADVYIKEKSGQKCIYCSKCGKYIKNANKNDLIAIEAAKNFFENTSSKNNDINDSSSYYYERLQMLVKLLNEELDEETKKPPISNEDAIRKASKVYELSAMRYTLEDILENAPKHVKGNYNEKI